MADSWVPVASYPATNRRKKQATSQKGNPMQRFTMRVQLDQEARQALVELCDRTGMTQIAVMSRVLTWFSRQNEVIQARVLGGLSSETVAELARQMLERMAAGELDEAGHRSSGSPSGSATLHGIGRGGSLDLTSMDLSESGDELLPDSSSRPVDGGESATGRTASASRLLGNVEISPVVDARSAGSPAPAWSSR